MMDFSLTLTHRCNLACTYCYAGHASKPDMSLHTAITAVDFAFKMTPPGEMVEFGFFGGEALLRFGLMKRICHEIRLKAQHTQHPIRLKTTTNATFFTDEMLDFFEEHGIEICISVDGPAHIHDRHRVYRGGQGSLADTVQNLRQVLQRAIPVQVNAVYGPDTVNHLPKSLHYLVSQGVRSIHFSPDVCSHWNQESQARILPAFMALADEYCQYFRDEHEISVNIIDSKVILFIKGGYSLSDRCGMATKQWAIAPSGNIFPCERLIGKDDARALVLGNVHTGLDRARCVETRARCGNRDEACQLCALKRYCMNWCGCTNYFMTGYTDRVGDAICTIERAAMFAAQHAMNTLATEDNELFIDHFMRYLVRDGKDYVQKGVFDECPKELNVLNSRHR